MSDLSSSGIEVGMYVRTLGESTGRVVERGMRGGLVWYLVKLSDGQLLWCRPSSLIPRVAS